MQPFISQSVHEELERSWIQLRALLDKLAPETRVPVAVLALTSTAGAGAVSAHLERTVGMQWPPTVTSRMASVRVLPLLPQHQAEGCLAEALKQVGR